MEKQEWMVRTSENFISGPYSKEDVCRMILENTLSLEDEVCCSVGYWISIKEREEVRKLLGIDVPDLQGQAHHSTSNPFDQDEITAVDLVAPQDSGLASADLGSAGQKFQKLKLIMIGIAAIGIGVWVALRLRSH